MRRSSSLSAAAVSSTTPTPDAPSIVLTRGTAAGSAEVIRALAKDHDRIAQDMKDVVVHRIFAAGLDLQAALGLIGDHRGTDKIYHAIGELDQAIRDMRNAVFDLELCDPRSYPRRARPSTAVR
jgi:signal transduction histidine kinase